MKTEEIAALRAAAEAHIQPDGTPHHWGASDKLWRAYRALATPANILSLLARLDTQQAELAEQERQKLSMVQELAQAERAGKELSAQVLEAINAGFLPAPTCQRDCQKCEKGESRTGSELLGLMLCPSQQPNPHKDPNFFGCWGNAECPCDSKAPEDCPLYMAPEPEAAASGAGVGLQGEEEDPIGYYETDGQPVYQSDDWVHDGDVYLRRHEAEAIVEDNMAGLQGEEGGGRG